MNQTTRYVMEIYQVSVAIRDTLEYVVQRKEGYKIEAYQQKGAIIKNALSERHPLSNFLNENKEPGDKIRGNLQDFYELVYGEESRAVFVENDAVVVDNGYSTQIIDYVVGLHETFHDILKGFVNFTKENKTYEEGLEVLLAKENAYYRCVASLVITDKIHQLFVEFNKSMHESNGQPSPTSNFISGDLRKHIGFFKFVREHSDIEDDIYKLANEKTEYVIDCMSGKTKLDETGEALRKEIINLHELWTKAVVLAEAEWRSIYQAMVQDLLAFDQAQREAAAKAAPAEAAAPAEEQPAEEQPAEDK